MDYDQKMYEEKLIGVGHIAKDVLAQFTDVGCGTNENISS